MSSSATLILHSFDILSIPRRLQNNYICAFVQQGAEVHLVPWDQDLLSLDYDGLFISNGPGDPSLAKTLINNVHKVGCFTNVYGN